MKRKLLAIFSLFCTFLLDTLIAIGERLNGIIKNKYLTRYKPKSFEQALFLLKKIG